MRGGGTKRTNWAYCKRVVQKIYWLADSGPMFYYQYPSALKYSNRGVELNGFCCLLLSKMKYYQDTDKLRLIEKNHA